MDIQTIAIGITIILGMAELWFYWCGIRARTFKPNTITWLTWSLLFIITFAAQIHEHAGAAAYLSLFFGLINFSVAVYGLRYWSYNVRPTDFIALGGALIAIGLWIATDNPLWAVILVAFIDLCGLFPTFRKTWHQPHDEILTTYGLALAQFGFQIIALDVRNVITMLHPLTVFLADGTFIIMAIGRRRLLQNKTI